MKQLLFTCTLALSVSFFGQAQQKANRYLGQPVPTSAPELFAPGLVSTNGRTEFGSVFSKDGNTFYYAIEPNGKAEIHSIKL